jgi:RNA recognition motif. (a.k.a. RRM, RBD, or RNP domain)
LYKFEQVGSMAGPNHPGLGVWGWFGFGVGGGTEISWREVSVNVGCEKQYIYICIMRMTISGLPRHFDKFDLQRLFNPFGWVDYTRILIDPLSGLSKGKGIVEMSRDDQAKQAMAALQGKVLGTNPLNIKEVKEGGAKPPPEAGAR